LKEAKNLSEVFQITHTLLRDIGFDYVELHLKSDDQKDHPSFVWSRNSFTSHESSKNGQWNLSIPLRINGESESALILSKERGGLLIPLRFYLLTETFAACLEEALEKTLIR